MIDRVARCPPERMAGGTQDLLPTELKGEILHPLEGPQSKSLVPLVKMASPSQNLPKALVAVHIDTRNDDSLKGGGLYRQQHSMNLSPTGLRRTGNFQNRRAVERCARSSATHRAVNVLKGHSGPATLRMHNEQRNDFKKRNGEALSRSRVVGLSTSAREVAYHRSR